jgi:phage-related minor tail protein
MGFMDKMKDAASQAGEMAKSAGQSMTKEGMTDAAAYRDRAIKLNNSGVNTPATIKSMNETGKTDVGGGKEVAFEVDIAPAAGEAYTTTFTQSMQAGVLEGINVGDAITVRVDPDDRNSMLFWGGAA